MVDLPRHSDWPFEEPDTLAGIQASLPALLEAQPLSRPQSWDLRDRIGAAWLGRIAGCNLGKPVENGSHWTVERIRDYLERAGAYPPIDYFPVLEPMPVEFRLHVNWRDSTRATSTARPATMTSTTRSSLSTSSSCTVALRPEHVAEAWTSLLPLQQVFTAERAVYVNLANGLVPPGVATYRNPYREWIGAQIRGDVFGYVLPGNPWAAAALAYQDASLSHVGNGVYGEMWAAALVSAAFTTRTAHETVTASLCVVPPRSRLAAAIRHVLQLHTNGVGWEDALAQIRQVYGHYAWVHTVNNAAVVVAGLLWGDGDYLSSVGTAVMSGWDTDSNGATVGSVAGIMTGTAALPAHLVEPLHDRTRSALFGFDHSSISDLAARTHTLATGPLFAGPTC